MTVTFEEARRKARYGHRDWLVYDRAGETICERVTRASIKSALLAGGTKRGLTIIGRDTGICYRHSWRVAINILRNFQHIYAA